METRSPHKQIVAHARIRTLNLYPSARRPTALECRAHSDTPEIDPCGLLWLFLADSVDWVGDNNSPRLGRLCARSDPTIDSLSNTTPQTGKNFLGSTSRKYSSHCHGVFRTQRAHSSGLTRRTSQGRHTRTSRQTDNSHHRNSCRVSPCSTRHTVAQTASDGVTPRLRSVVFPAGERDRPGVQSGRQSAVVGADGG